MNTYEGTTGTIWQTKLVSSPQINIDMNDNFGGATKFITSFLNCKNGIQKYFFSVVFYWTVLFRHMPK